MFYFLFHAWSVVDSNAFSQKKSSTAVLHLMNVGDRSGESLFFEHVSLSDNYKIAQLHGMTGKYYGGHLKLGWTSIARYQ